MLSSPAKLTPTWYTIGSAVVVVALGALGGYSLYRYQRGIARRSAAEIVSSTLKSRLASSPSPFSEASSSSDSVFEVTAKNGFLPNQPIPARLPDAYSELEELMKALPKLLHDSQNASALADAVASLPLYNIDAKTIPPALRQALFRDLSIVVSAYILEGTSKGGAPRTRVPRNLSLPFFALSNLLDEPPIMSYDSYCLTNCYNEASQLPAWCGKGAKGGAGTPAAGPTPWEVLRLVRSFDGGPEEITFVTVHFEIESHTPLLISAYSYILGALAAPGASGDVAGALTSLRRVQERIIVSQLKMFNASDPRNYERFVRPWIFGWKGNADLAGGVTFEGVGDEGADLATFLRGETGAQSTIIPSLDAMLGIAHSPDAMLKFLTELEAYRPAPHRRFLASLRHVMWGGGGEPPRRCPLL